MIVPNNVVGLHDVKLDRLMREFRGGILDSAIYLSAFASASCLNVSIKGDVSKGVDVCFSAPDRRWLSTVYKGVVEVDRDLLAFRISDNRFGADDEDVVHTFSAVNNVIVQGVMDELSHQQRLGAINFLRNNRLGAMIK